jgi:methyl-accepting chemotaxis protein
MLRRLSIAQRIVLNLMLTLGLAGLVALGFGLALRDTQREAGDRSVKILEDEVQHTLQVSTHAMASALGAAVRRAGPAGEAEAVADVVRDLRYGDDKSGYFFVYRGTQVVLNPIRPNDAGKDMGPSQDADGVYFIRELARVAGAGGGFVRYVFDKPGAGQVPKLSYAEAVPGSDLWVGTGVYMDNLDAMRADVITQLAALTTSAMKTYLLPLVLVAVFLILPLTLRTAQSIIQPLRGVRDAMREVAQGDGDLTRRLDEEGTDEVAELASAFNAFSDSLRQIIRGLGEVSTVLTESADGLGSSTHRMTHSAGEIRNHSSVTHRVMEALKGRVGVIAHQSREASGEVEQVASTTQALSSSASQVVAGSESISRQVDDLAAAMEELSTSFKEVASRSAETAQVGQASQDRVDAVVEQMGRLERASKAIGKVVDLITGVADQTNLLALNASIEAAGAGAAGRGFAVVANEVKVLAKRTGDATQEIRRQVEEMQSTTQKTLEMVQDVGVYAGEVGRLTAAIAAASEEQTATLNELAKSINEGASSVRVIKSSIATISGGVDQLAASSNHLAEGSQQMAGAADQMAGDTEEAFGDLSALLQETDRTVKEIEGVGGIVSLLQGRAASLQDVVGRFRV